MDSKGRSGDAPSDVLSEIMEQESAAGDPTESKMSLIAATSMRMRAMPVDDLGDA